MSNFSLTVKSKDEVEKQIINQINPTSEEDIKLQQTAVDYVEDIFSSDMNNSQRKRDLVNGFTSFNIDSIKNASKDNSMLRMRVGKIAQVAGKDSVSTDLLELNSKMRDLDPSALDFTKTTKFGKMFDPVKKYFDKFEQVGPMIDKIVDSLEKSKKQLTHDNVTLALEEDKLMDKSQQISKEIKMSIYMDEEIERRISEASARGIDEDSIKFIQEQLLFPLRQAIQDKQQMLLINQQGIIGLHLTQENNAETIRGISRTQYLVVSALNTGGMLAAALFEQKRALEKTKLANQMIDSVMKRNASLIKQQAAEVRNQAVQPAVNVETFKQVFTDLFDTIEAMSTFKIDSLPVMKDTIGAFNELSERGQKTVDMIERKSNKFNLM